MVTLAFLLFIGARGVAIGGHIHDLTLSSVCRLDVKIRVGDVVSWTNPTKETIRLAGEGCHAKLNVTVLSKRESILSCCRCFIGAILQNGIHFSKLLINLLI